MASPQEKSSTPHGIGIWTVQQGTSSGLPHKSVDCLWCGISTHGTTMIYIHGFDNVQWIPYML